MTATTTLATTSISTTTNTNSINSEKHWKKIIGVRIQSQSKGPTSKSLINWNRVRVVLREKT